MISQNLQQFGYLTQGLDEIMPLQWNYLRFSLTWSGLTGGEYHTVNNVRIF